MTPKTLLIGRHGEKLNDPNISDWDLPLTHTGISQCRMNGNSLVLEGIKPDFLLCSSSQRTQKSLDALISQIFYEDTPPVLELCGEDLYKAYNAQTMIDVLADYLPEKSSCPLVMGHNPGMHHLAWHLSQKSQPHMVDTIHKDFPSSTLCVFNVSCGKWSDLSPQTCELIHIFSGKRKTISRYKFLKPDM